VQSHCIAVLDFDLFVVKVMELAIDTLDRLIGVVRSIVVHGMSFMRMHAGNAAGASICMTHMTGT